MLWGDAGIRREPYGTMPANVQAAVPVVKRGTGRLTIPASLPIYVAPLSFVAPRRPDLGPTIAHHRRSRARYARFGCPLYLALRAVLSATRLAAQAGTLQGSVSDSGGTTLPNASVTVEGTGLRATTGANGRVRGPRRAGRHLHRPRPADRLPGRGRAGDDRRRRRGAAGLHPQPEHGAARADRRGRRLARPPHRGRGAGRAGRHLPGRAAGAAGQHRDQRHPPGGLARRSTSPARASPTRATWCARSPSAA